MRHRTTQAPSLALTRCPQQPHTSLRSQELDRSLVRHCRPPRRDKLMKLLLCEGHYRIKRNQRRKMHRHMGRRKVVLVLCQAAVLSSTTGTTRYLRVPRILQCRGWAYLYVGGRKPERPGVLGTTEAGGGAAGLSRPATPPPSARRPRTKPLRGHPHPPDSACCPSRLPRLPLPRLHRLLVRTICFHSICDSILSNGSILYNCCYEVKLSSFIS